MKTLTTADFVERARSKHGDRFNYDETHYVNAKTKVTICCPDHGYFDQIPDSHLNSNSGCPRCGYANRKTYNIKTEEFIERANKVHLCRYNYDKVACVNGNTKVTIKCFVHGTFRQTPAMHLRGQGCPACGRQSSRRARAKTTEEFIQNAQRVHGTKYSYDKTSYVNTHTKVVITCPTHGDFLQKPNSHTSQQNGCPACAKQKHPGRYTLDYFSLPARKQQAGIFYVVEFRHEREHFIKIGITSTSVQKRHVGKTKPYRVKTLIEMPMTLYDAYVIEEKLKRTLSPLTYNPVWLTEGCSECFLPTAIREVQVLLDKHGGFNKTCLKADQLS